MPGYRLESLTKRFGATVALDGVSFDAPAGAFVVVLGPTGAGKTTLLRTIAGLEQPDGGRIVATEAGGAETDVTPLAPAARDMAMVFQNFSLYPRMTVFDNLAFPLRPRWRKMPRAEIERRVRWAAELLGITEKLPQKPTELSGGQQQRVAIGRAIVREPQLFLFDEPLASLDAKLRESMTVEIHRLQRRLNVTMLYVTHDQTEAMGLADTIVVLDRGQVLQIGPPAEVYAKPASPRVARMLGSPPINLLTPPQARLLGVTAPGATVGIRPEHIRLTPDAVGPATVRVVEHLGATTTVTLHVSAAGHEGGAGFDVRTIAAPADPLTPGQRFRIQTDLAKTLAW